MAKQEQSGRSMIGKAVSHGSDALTLFILERMGEHVGGGLEGLAAGAAAIYGKHVLSSMRSAGIQSVNDLIDRALLDPALARALLMKVRPGGDAMAEGQLTAALKRLALVRSVQTGDSP